MKLVSIIARAAYATIANNLPSSATFPSMGKLRVKLARLFAPQINMDANIENHATFSSRVSVGEYGNIGKRAYIQGKVDIGKHVMMGPECNIWTINHKTDRWDVPMCEQGNEEERPVVIEDDVWIGSRVTILPGVHIGTGSIIGAGSVVSKSVPEYSVVVGNPAKVIRSRKDK